MPERIVVVGHAAVTCLGCDMDATWPGLVAGRSGIRRHAEFGAATFLQDVAGVVDDFGPGTASEDPAIAQLAARSIHLSLAAARSAWADAGLERAKYDADRVAVVVGSALGGLDLLDAERSRMTQRRNLATSPFLIPGLIINQAAGQVAQHLGLHGPSVAPANACASGGHAVALGAMFLRAGEADFALCGAGESAFTPAIVNGFATMKALLPRKPEDRSASDPSQASRPFSVDRAGFVLSEGAGMLVLATESAARRLGLDIQAELAGWALNSDGHHMAHAPRRADRRLPEGRPEPRRGSPRRGRLLQRTRHEHPDQRPGRDRCAQAGLRQARADLAGQLDQGSARAQPGRGLGDRGGRLRPSDPRAGHSAHDQSHARPRARPRLRPE